VIHGTQKAGGIICFIDEVRESLTPYASLLGSRDVHLTPPDTLFNLGKAEGSIDAGQMIKPALARGLQLVGATTRKHPHRVPLLYRVEHLV
jgi:hypothetical protein